MASEDLSQKVLSWKRHPLQDLYKSAATGTRKMALDFPLSLKEMLWPHLTSCNEFAGMPIETLFDGLPLTVGMRRCSCMLLVSPLHVYIYKCAWCQISALALAESAWAREENYNIYKQNKAHIVCENRLVLTTVYAKSPYLAILPFSLQSANSKSFESWKVIVTRVWR
jgi:hypothetical protein